MSPMSAHPTAVYARFPRVSGDEPNTELIVGAINPFSPRERG